MPYSAIFLSTIRKALNPLLVVYRKAYFKYIRERTFCVHIKEVNMCCMYKIYKINDGNAYTKYIHTVAHAS